MSDISGSGDFFERDPYSKDFSKLSNVFSAVDHIQPIFCTQTCGEYLAHLADKIGSAEPAEVWQDTARCTCMLPCRHKDFRKQKHFMIFTSRPNNTKYHSSIYHHMSKSIL